jgi:hypothetical protein
MSDNIRSDYEEMSALDYQRDEMLSAFEECEGGCGRVLDVNEIGHCECGRALCKWCHCCDCEDCHDEVENPLL